ncbi:UDP-glucose dehydrogenase family protein [Fictibacillus aquaticus]|uniref:UDP-glucose dehydrogenase family protein n=1 Tax=Fictibacillus aquaticus TaxID=2021314 RepID=UPI0013FD5341|nr:UDP-glucose/GDP-mannose dehydrogenase family protein [Fictibacillus aquaticus]
MKAGIFGAGYVGLVTAAGLASRGLDIAVHDTSKEKIATLTAGGLPIFEPGLEKLLAEQHITYIQTAKELVTSCRYLFLCVGTPQAKNGEADLSFLESAVKTICRYADSDKIVIIKSTVPPGTGRLMEKLSETMNIEHRITFVSNPEFLRQGNAVQDFLFPDRIVIGSDDDETGTEVLQLYKQWDCPKLQMNRESAELTKYAANTFLAMKISYMNMMAGLAEKTGANIEDIERGIGSDSRIGKDFLKAGAGFGGSCFPKDLRALASIGTELNEELPLIRETLYINENQAKAVLRKLSTVFGGLLGRKIAVLGLSFKPMTDDVRSSPAVSAAEQLLLLGADVNVYDPLVRDNPVAGAVKSPSLLDCLEGCDAAIIMTEWDEFREILKPKMLNKLKSPVIVDGRNMFQLKEMKKLSREFPLYYDSVGRQRVNTLLTANKIK